MKTPRTMDTKPGGLSLMSSVPWRQPSILRLCARGALGALAVLPLAGSASASAAPPPPLVSTEAAREVAFDAASLSGAVDPNGTGASSATRWCFEYGDGSAEGYNLGRVPAIAQEAGAGTSAVPVDARLTGLSAGTTYRYRLVAVNDLEEGSAQNACGIDGGQQTTGSEGIFTTPIYVPPPLVVTGGASSVEQNTATLAGTVNPEGSRTTYEFQVGFDTSYGVEIFGSAGSGTQAEPFTITLNNLQPATTYHYRLVATNAGGTIYGADQAFTTGAYPTTTLIAPPTQPLLSIPAIAFPMEPQTVAPVVTTHKKPKKTAAKTKIHKNGKTARNMKRHHASKRGER